MKTINSTLLVTVFSLLFLSCSEDEGITLNNKIDCTSNFQSHTNDLAFQKLLDNNTKDGFVGMTLLIDHPIDGLWMGSAGYANIEEGIAMNPCNIHHTASLYKTYIATVILQLVEENKVKLDDKLTNYLSADIIDRIPNGNLISIKNLLQHRTGIPDIFEIEFITEFFNDPTKQFSIEELLEFVYDKTPLSEVDSEFYYSDANFSVLSLVIEKVEGSYIEALESRIFEPLQLDDTYFLQDVNQTPDGLANSYWDRYNDGNFENNTEVQVALTVGLSGSDGIVTTADNLKSFMKALSTGDLVSDLTGMTNFLDVPATVQENSVYTGYGMGLMKVQISNEEWYGHFGNQIGSGAIVLFNAERDITIVALQNTGTFFSDEIKGKFFYQLLADIEAILFG